MADRGDAAAARLIGRATLRRHRFGVTVVTQLIGVAGRAVLAAAAGARRTATVMDRFSAFSRNADIEIDFGRIDNARLRDLEEDPAIAELAPLHQFAILFAGQSEFLPAAGALDDRFGTVVDRARVIRGGLPDSNKVNEVAIGEILAQRLHLDVGDVLDGQSYSIDDVQRAIRSNVDPGAHGPAVHLDVVGIVRRPLDLSSRGAKGGVVVMTPAFTKKYINQIGSFAGTLGRVRSTGSTADAIAAARERFKVADAFSVQPLAFETEGARDAINVLTIALALFAAIAGAAALVFIAIVMQRQLGVADNEQVQLAALGVSRRTRMSAVLISAVPMIVGGATVAVLGAAAASMLFPFGVARRAEPNPGIDFDWPALIIGFAVIIAVTVTISLVTAMRVTRPAVSVAARPTVRPSRLAQSARQAGLPATTTTGIGFAFEAGRGRAAVPVRSALIGAVVGVAGVAAVLVYGASFDRLVASPARYGWSMSGIVRSGTSGQMSPGRCDIKDPALADNPAFSAAGIVCSDAVEVDGRSVDAWGFRSLRGIIEPTILRGRAATSPSEITLGTVTLKAIGKHLGDHVTVTTDAGALDYEIVGVQVLPSPAAIEPLPIADNAGMTAEGFERVLKNAPEGADFDAYATLAHPDRISSLRRTTLPFDSSGAYVDVGRGAALQLPVVPDELIRVRDVDELPILLGCFLASLGLAAIAHTLFASVRRRGRELAILRSLGFRRAQVRRTIGWEAGSVATIGLLVGIPAGVFIGRMAWTAIANSLGVDDSVTIPGLALLALAGVTLVLVVLLGFLSARGATCVPPAVALTVE
jgi:hypothetical protein